MNHLAPRDRLKDLYLMGNPAEAEWSHFKSYVIAKLPQLTSLDGTDITKSMQIIAKQKLPEMERGLKQLAIIKKREKEQKLREKQDKEAGKTVVKAKKKKEARVVELDENDNEVVCEDVSSDEEEEEEDDNPLTENTPEVREEIYRELAQQKKERRTARTRTSRRSRTMIRSKRRP